MDITPNAPAVPIATYNDVDEALGIIVRVCQFMSWNLLAERGFSSIAATPQFGGKRSINHALARPSLS